MPAAQAAQAPVAQIFAGDPAAQIQGNWLTQGRDGIIQITRTAAGAYEGRIVGGNDPTGLDSHNPDPALRKRLLLGTVILHDLHYDGGGRWSGGHIYDPDNGRTYGCNIEYTGGNLLKIRGFWGFSLLGETQRWTRYAGRSLTLPPVQ